MEGNHEHKAALPNGTRLRQYRIEKVLGVGSFGVTYLAHDNDLQSHFAIKEYIPNEFALREGATVHPKSSANEDDYRWGLSRFLQEARELAKFRHANIVRVHQIFEENNTAYMVLDFEEGVNFDRWLKNLGRQPAEKELRAILSPLLDALEQVHANGLLHRDIAPDNIIIHPNGKPVLLDFGSARQAMGMRSKSVSAIVKAGYSPPEQYSTRGEQGAYTDIYALSATMYRAINGAAPPEGSWRMMEMATADKDPMTPLQGDGYSPALRQGIERGLAINARNRPQTVAAWREILSEDTAASSPAHSLAEAKTRKIPQSPTRKSGKGKGLWLGLCAVALLLIIGYSNDLFTDTKFLPSFWATDPAQVQLADGQTLAVWIKEAEGRNDYSRLLSEIDALLEEYPRISELSALSSNVSASITADKEAFEQAKSMAAGDNIAAGIAAVDSYLSSYPAGQFIAEAEELKETLQQRQQKAIEAADKEALAKADKEAFEHAKSMAAGDNIAAGIAAVDSYLSSYPAGQFIADAKKLKETLQQRQQEAIKAAEKEALAKADKEAFEQAKSTAAGDNIAAGMAAVDSYLSSYPAGQFIADAKKLKETLQQRQQEAIKAAEKEALAKADKEAFEQAKSTAAGDNIAEGMAAVDSYLSSYPEGQFIAEAKELKKALQQQQEAIEAAEKEALAKADKEAFEQAKSMAAGDNIAEGMAAVDSYLSSYPEGQFIAEAKELKKALQQQQEAIEATIAELRIKAAAEAQKRENNQFTILHYAARYNDPEIIAALLNAGANIHEKDKDGKTPLHFAAVLNDNPEIIAALMNAGANIHEKDKDGKTPLHFAAANNDNLEIIAALLNAGANIHEKDKDGKTPLHFAARYNDSPEIIAALVNAGANIHEKDKDGKTPLHFAAWNNDNPEIIAALVNAGANIHKKDKEGKTPLHFAAMLNGNPEIIAALVNAGANIHKKDKDGMTPLHFAAVSNGNPGIIAALVNAGANTHVKNKVGITPLQYAASINDAPEIIAALVNAGANIHEKNKDGDTPLHFAASINDDPKIIAALVNAGANIHEKNNGGFTPLHFAASNSVPEIIAALMNAGANIHEKNKDGNTPLHFAAANNDNPEIIAALMNAGANIHEKNKDGNTPLHFAAYNNDNPEIIAALMNAGANIHEKNKDGFTPLHFAAYNNDNLKITNALMNAGANVNATNNAGETSLDVAIRRERPIQIINAIHHAGGQCTQC